MSLVFNSPQNHHTFYRNPISAADLHSGELLERTDEIRLEHAGMHFRNWCFDGFRLAYNVLDQSRETSYAIRNDIDAVKIYFNRSGKTRIHYRQLSKHFSIGPGQYNMLYSAELDSRMSHIDHHSALFSLQITPNCFRELTGKNLPALQRFMDKTDNGQPALFSPQWLPMNMLMEKNIDEMVNCPFTGDLKKLYLRSKAIELFVHFAQAGNGEEPAVKNTADRNKLFEVRDYLIRHYADPTSLPELARKAGLNEFKLKRGFKALFHTSVIDFLISHRLEQARDMLLHSDKNISEVAYETGYASPAYFSKAFKKKYGINPKDLH